MKKFFFDKNHLLKLGLKIVNKNFELKLETKIVNIPLEQKEVFKLETTVTTFYTIFWPKN